LTLSLPHLTYAAIGAKANTFLSKYHPSYEIPIPVEKIVDVDMGINIFPYPGLYKVHGQNGFLSKDRTTINVDEYQYDNYYSKCRFTIAHELGHYLLHESCYNDLQFNSPEEYERWLLTEESDVIDWFEKHGDWFAEQLLVPRQPLVESCKRVVKKHEKALLKLKKVPDDFWSYASNEIATYFDVNPPVVEIRIRREKISLRIVNG
jgi:hypothetical protein